MAKNVTKAPPGERESREPALAAEPGRKPLSLDDEGFLPGIAEELAAIPRDRRVLLNIPIWGWTGDGKTCALITAVYFCDPAEHPLGFSLIWDLEQLTAFENSAEEYRGLGLAATASGTTERLRQLSEMLIDRNEWPPGTDEPSGVSRIFRTDC